MRGSLLARRAFAQLPPPVRDRVRSVRRRIGAPRQRRTADVLAGIRAGGVVPRTIVDVGAAYGGWALEAQRHFPDAQLVLVEPLSEYAKRPQSVRGRLRNAVEVDAAATAESGTIEINVHEDLVGSSLKREQEGAVVDGRPRQVRAVTVDDLCAEHSCSAPYLLKVDVQGAELDVLAGARRTLKEAEVVVLEVSFFRFFHGGPMFHEVVAHMAELGFVVYDLVDHIYRPLDGALAQLDAVFVREDGPLRAHHVYATPEQRADEAARLRLAQRA